MDVTFSTETSHLCTISLPKWNFFSTCFHFWLFLSSFALASNENAMYLASMVKLAIQVCFTLLNMKVTLPKVNITLEFDSRQSLSN